MGLYRSLNSLQPEVLGQQSCFLDPPITLFGIEGGQGREPIQGSGAGLTLSLDGSSSMAARIP